jgi:hypothetical protein
VPEREELTDLVAKRAKENPRVQAIVDEARLYDGLKENEAWQRLARRVNDQRERFTIGIARRLMSGQKVSDEEIAYNRGFYYGAEWILKHPEEAEKSLEHAALGAWRMLLLEEALQQDAESPYIDPQPQEG